MAEKAHTSSEGWVYLIVNDQMSRHVKIGKTDRDPIERARELVSTGTVGTFVVIYQAWVRDPYAVEQRVHRTLSRHRKDGEWFDVCPNVAKQEIHSAAGEVQFEKVTPRWHPSQREPAPWTKVFLEEARLEAEEAENSRQADKNKEKADRLKEQKERERLAEIARRAKEEKWRRFREKLARATALLLLLICLLVVVALVSPSSRGRYVAKETNTITAAPTAKQHVAAATFSTPESPEVARRRSLFEQAKSRVAPLEANVATKRKVAADLEAQLTRFPHLRERRQGDLERARASLEAVTTRLVAKEERLKRLAIEEPRDLERSGELFRGDADVDKLRKQEAEAQMLVEKSQLAFGSLPEEERRIRDRLPQARAAVKEAEQRLAEEVEALEAAKRELAEVVRLSQ
jgi:hypothetical protein